MTSCRHLLRVAAATGCLACGGGEGGTEPDRPDPGPVDVILASPHADDGAVLLTITGGATTGVSAQGYELVSAATGPTTVRLIVRGSLVSGPVASLTLPDRRNLSDYRGTVDQAVKSTSYQVQALQGYTVRLQKPGL